MKWWHYLLLAALLTPIALVLLNALFFMPELIAEDMTIWDTLFAADRAPAMRWIMAASAAALGVLFLYLHNSNGLDNISVKPAGQGQYGESRWATAKERAEMYPRVSASRAKTSGVIVGYDKTSFEVDQSDKNVLIIAPPGAGKTKDKLIPDIIYNCRVNENTHGGGASMVVVDVKGEEYLETAEIARRAGYTVRVLDYRHPLSSDRYNMMHEVNKHFDLMRTATTPQEQIIHRAQAERHAKILASAIMNTAGVHTSAGSESSQFFSSTAEGLITAMILVVSEYGLPSERHLPSVFRMIIEMNGLVQEENQSDIAQKSRLKQLFEHLPSEHRSKLFAGASMNADVRTSMNIFSSAMAKLLNYVDAELEQMICGHDEGFTAEAFVAVPTIIYLIVPDEDPTRHIFSALFIRQFLTSLIGYASEQPTLTLPRKVLFFWDEFGNSPPIKDLAAQFTAARSRGIRLIIAVQSYAQLEEKYGRIVEKIIREATQITIFSLLSPSANMTAKELSDSLGPFTTQSGSQSKGDKSNSRNVTLIGRALLMPSEIMQLKIGTFIVMHIGHKPIKTELKPFNMVWKGLPRATEQREQRPIIDVEILTEEKIIARTAPLIAELPREEDPDGVVHVPPDRSTKKKGLRRKGEPK